MLIFSLFLLQMTTHYTEMVCSSTFKPFKGTGGNHFEFLWSFQNNETFNSLLKTLFNVVLCPLRLKGIGNIFQHFSCCIPLYNVYIVWFSRNGNKMTYF